MAFDWLPGLFQSEQTRGLSGDSASAVALDESNPYYNYRLRRHQTDGDPIDDPALLWHTSALPEQRSGLGVHIASEKGEGVANFTDILLILSADDMQRADANFQARVTQKLSQQFEAFCKSESFSRVFSHRKLAFRVYTDGSDAMNGQSLGLGEGQFVTGLLPNFYTGPQAGSKPVIGVHLNLPGVFEGYQEVGRLFNDQILFTIGNHWLDNFSHPSLREAALYRLRQYPDGSFVHIVNPDLQDRYQVSSHEQGGTNVLTLATRDGEALAYMVLAVMESDIGSDIPEEEVATRPNIAMPVAPEKPREREPATPDVAPPMLIDDAVENISPQRQSKTIIPDAPSERIFTLQERGALLQKVHFSAFMEGYDVYMGSRGELGTVVDNPAATFQVRRRSVSLKAHVDLQVGGRRLPAGSEFVIDGDTTIEVGGEKLQYRDLRGLKVDGWPYVGEIRRPASSTYMIWGEKYRIGRSRECRVVLPDEPRNDNIAWKASVGDGATIRARTGEIPKSKFYTDSIMVASEHASLDTSVEHPEISCTARHCYIYIRRGSEVMPLYPTTSGKTPQTLPLQTGDEVLIGNCLFQAGFSEKQEARAATAPPPMAPEVSLNADDLVGAVSEPDFAELDEAATGGIPADPPTSMGDLPPPPSEPPLPPAPPAPEPLSTPLQQGGMESVMGSTSTAEPVAELRELKLPSLEEVGDDPTAPGMTVPRELLDEEDDGVHDIEEPADLQTERNAEPLVDLKKDVVQGWEEDDWSEETGPHDSPPAPPVDEEPTSRTVPAPFADLEMSISDAPEPGAAKADSEGGEDDRDEDFFATWNPDAEGDAPTEAVPRLEVPPEDVVPASGATVQSVPEPMDADDPPTEATEVVSSPAPAPAKLAEKQVVYTDDSEAQFELGRPLHLVQAGWMVRGELVAGNHTGCELVIPENRIEPDQTFEPAEYFRLKVRGRKGHLEVLAPSELLIDEDDPKQEIYDDLSKITVDVIRRDDQGEEDFVVRVIVSQDPSLPDPRARFVALDYEDPLAAALVTRGLGLAQVRRLTFDGLAVDLEWTGDVVRFSNYQGDYKSGKGISFFVQKDKQRFVTAPEDGSPFELSPGDRFVVGTVVYLVRGL